MVTIDDREIMPTHQVEIVHRDGKVTREQPAPRAVAQGRADYLKAHKPADVKVVRVVPAKR
jgi:hypothetical protein